MSAHDNLIKQTALVITSPASIQRTAFEFLEAVSDGELTLTDTSNPFAALIGANAAMVAAAVSKMEVAHRSQYEKASISLADLHNHISDRDISEIFAKPSKINIELSFAMNELENKLVYDDTLGIKKLVIPRNTVFTVSNIPFSLQYPVEIRKMEHGGLTIVYDTSITSPLKQLDTNAVPWGEFQYTSIEGTWLTMQLEVDQFNIVSKKGSIVQSTQFFLDIAFTDLFYTARVYITDNSGEYEIPVVISNRVIDLAQPCAVIAIYEKAVRVSIPQVFTQNGKVSGNVRVDIYQTKGDINIDLSAYAVTEFTVNWLALKPSEKTIFVAPLTRIESIAIASQSTTVGGRAALSSDEIRKRIFDNSIGQQKIPITPSQIGAAITDLGYTLIKDIDVVTDRVFLATREILAPKFSDYSALLSQTITPRASNGIPASIGVLVTKLETIIDKSGIIDNGERVTITPKALFVNENGTLKHLTQTEFQTLQSLSLDQLVLELNTLEYRYSPFHYVLDTTSTDFDLRAYYLENPKTTNKLFVAENATALLQVGIDIVDFAKVDEGYSILIRTTSSDAVRKLINDNDLICQIATIPGNQKDRAYLNGTLYRVEENGERIYEFILKTKFDIDRSDRMIFQDFFMYSQDPVDAAIPLKPTFDVFFLTSADVGPQYRYSDIDSKIGKAILPSMVYTISHEQLVFDFGDVLKSLWKRSRSYIDETAYERHTVNIPSRYTEVEYERDPLTGQIFRIVNGEVVYNPILHNVNDIRYDDQGDVVYLYQAGDIIYENGEPVIRSERAISRYLDILLLDGLYYFATDASIKTYREDAHRTLTSWIVNDLGNLSKATLDNTSVFFHPKVMIGLMEVIVDDNRRANIRAEQSLVIDMYVTDAVNNNDALKNTLVNKATSVIRSELAKVQIALSSIIEELHKAFGDDVIDVNVKGLGGTINHSAITIVSEHTRCSVKQKLITLADNTTTVVDDISFNWIRHTV